MRIFPLSAFSCLLAALFLLSACREKIPSVTPEEGTPPPVVEEEDPVLQQETPGAYGVPGGNILPEDGWQTGILRYGNHRQNFRLIHPAQARVISLSGLPRPLSEGMEVNALYRETVRGYTRTCIPYRLRVLRVREHKAWLKESDQTYFVIEE